MIRLEAGDHVIAQGYPAYIDPKMSGNGQHTVRPARVSFQVNGMQKVYVGAWSIEDAMGVQRELARAIKDAKQITADVAERVKT